MKDPKVDVKLTDPDFAKQFVINKRMTRAEIKNVRRAVRTARYIPGFPIKLTPDVRAEIEKILEEKEKALDEEKQ